MAILDKINLDFQIIPTWDPKALIVMDISVWGFIENKPAIIEILTPGSTTEKVFNFVKGKSNVFNSSNLLLSRIGDRNDLSDGVYTISVKGSPDSYCKKRYYLKTDKIQFELDKLYMSLGIHNKDKETAEKRSTILKIESLIKTAEAFVRDGKISEGMKFFKAAYTRLKSISNCKDC